MNEDQEPFPEDEVRLIVRRLFQWGESVEGESQSEDDPDVRSWWDHTASRLVVENGYERRKLTSGFVGRFIRSVRFELDEKNPSQSKVYLAAEALKEVEVLKQFSYAALILSPRLRVPRHRRQTIVREVFETLVETKREGWKLLPDDYRAMYQRLKNDEATRHRLICDFIAGMTDRYIIEFHKRLKAADPVSIFKPM